MPLALLLSMQAAGMVVDWLGKNEQIRLGRMGAEVEQAGIAANIKTSQLETEEASLASMKQLRQNLGSQAAIMAARGTRSGAGNSVLFSNESVSNFNADERTRRINQLGTEANLKAGLTLSKLHETTNENKIWGDFRQNVYKQLPTTPAAYNQYAKSFGLTPIGG